VRLDEIIVGVRHRRDLGDLVSLAQSIDNVGLLHPVVVTSDKRLVAGERRLRAVQLLGWDEIDTRIVDLTGIVEAERDENTQRLDFSPSEAVAIARELEPIERAAASERQRAGKTPPVDSTEGHGNTRDRVAAATGMGATTLAKAREIVEAAEADDKNADLVEQMDATGKVEPAHRELRKRREGTIAPEHLRAEYTCPGCGRFTPQWVLAKVAPPTDEDDWRYLSHLPAYGGKQKTRAARRERRE
jgi:ParB-like chromosome segregation protein Spo0J